MKLIVGLGNPGLLYRASRHNAGSRLIKELAARHKISIRRNSLTYSMEGKGVLEGQGFILAQPLTYMNLSGRSVKALLKRHNVKRQDLLVVCDDMDLDVGLIRIRPHGSSGGHKGLKSIIDSLTGDDFARLRIGIGRPAPHEETTDFVLKSARREEKKEFSQAIDEAIACCQAWIKEGIVEAMNQFNRKRNKR
jgi:PTH1 family peptidyl-tRNA hydrolase